MKIYKGNYGSVRHQRKMSILRTIIIFAVDFALFLFGLYLNNGDRGNIWTIIAAVGAIPGALSVVYIIMYIRVPGMKREEYETIREHTKGLRVLYELYFTSYEKNMFVDATIICGDYVTCYTSTHPSQQDLAFMEKHIRKHVLQDGYKVTVKIFDNLKNFLERADQLAEKRESFEKGRDDKVEAVLMAISL